MKIGCSRDVEQRRRQLEKHYGKSLALLRVMEGDRATEREIHERFDHLRLRKAGRKGEREQFRPAPELMEWIGRPLLVGANPDAVEMMGQDLSAVKIDRGLASRARMIATDKGIDMAEYLSGILRATIERDWAKLIRRVGGSAQRGVTEEADGGDD